MKVLPNGSGHKHKLHDPPWQKQAENGGLLLPPASFHNHQARKAHEQNNFTLPLPHVLAVPLWPGKAAQWWHTIQNAAFIFSPIHDGWPQTEMLVSCSSGWSLGLSAASQIPRTLQEGRKGSFKLEWIKQIKWKILSPLSAVQHQSRAQKDVVVGCRHQDVVCFSLSHLLESLSRYCPS